MIASPDTDAQPRGRSALRLLVAPGFGALFWGKVISIIGVWTHGLVAAVVIYDITGSALMVGMVGVAQFGPQLLFGPLSGKRADLGNPIRQIVIGRLLCVVGAGSIAVLLAAMPGADGREVTAAGGQYVTAAGGQYVTAAVLLGSLVVGIGFVVGGPAMQAIVPALIRPGELPTAMALNSVPMTIGRMVGPVVGAVVATQFGAAAAFAVSAGLSMAFAALMVFVRLPSRPERDPETDYRVRAALRYVWNDRPMLLALLAIAVVGFASDPSITLAPSMAEEIGGDTHLVGAMTAAFGLGAALSLALLAGLQGRIGSAATSSSGLWLLAIGSTVLCVATVPWLALVGFAVAGFGFGAAMTGLSTVVQERAPEELRGRIMALWMVGFVGSRPFAAAVLGGSADLWSTRVAFVVAAAFVIVTAVACGRGRLVTGRS